MRFGAASAQRRRATTRVCSAEKESVGLRSACQTDSPALQADKGLDVRCTGYTRNERVTGWCKATNQIRSQYVIIAANLRRARKS